MASTADYRTGNLSECHSVALSNNFLYFYRFPFLVESLFSNDTQYFLAAFSTGVLTRHLLSPFVVSGVWRISMVEKVIALFSGLVWFLS